MPSRNSIKTFIEGGYYHIYNRGVNKECIFSDVQDYRVFLTYLKTYLLPVDKIELRALIMSSTVSQQEKDMYKKMLRLQNFNEDVTLLAYCLMPNHFHLLIRQKNSMSIEYFMRALSCRYVRYFNKRQNRVGPLFQGNYKAVLVESEEQLLYLSKYIHRNPLKVKQPILPDRSAIEAQPSSYSVYLGTVRQSWVHPEHILSSLHTKRIDSYRSFVEERSLGEDMVFVENLMIDEDG